MGLRETIAKAVDSAWAAIGDIPEDATFRRVSKTYSPATGQWVDSNTDYTVPIVFTRFEAMELDKVYVFAVDLKAIIKQNDMPVVPNTSSDRVVRNGTIYNVVRVFQDPAGATYTLQLRSA
jgi:hypothetical protein